MYITLADTMVRKLAALPEAGMGYQLVDVALSDGRKLEGLVVIDSTLLDVPAAAGAVDAADIMDIELRTNAGRKRRPM